MDQTEIPVDGSLTVGPISSQGLGPIIIDLSVDVDPDAWEPEPVRRKVLDHREGADKLGESYRYFKAQSVWQRAYLRLFKPTKHHIDRRDFPDGMGLSLMTYSLTTHTGTHLDAPYHYGWRSGRDGTQKTISDIPLSWCFAPGVLLDMRAGSGAIDEAAVRTQVEKIGYSLCAGDIVLINTGAGEYHGTKRYFTQYRAIDKSAIAWLMACGVKVIGTDAFSFDAPFCSMIDEYKASGNQDALWPAHVFGRDHEYIQIERLANLEALPSPTGFRVCCFPIKLKNSDAAWSRVVAILK